jgi:hypothetical protein
MAILQTLDNAVDPTKDKTNQDERSFNRLRIVAGVLGFALPLVLIIGDKAFLDTEWTVRGSLSAYYHSGMRDVFVGILIATGVSLIAYRMASKGDARNGFSTFAGFAAIGVAVFPTGIPKELREKVDETPLQEAIGAGLTSGIHAVCAFALIATLCVMSIIFWRREGLREQGTTDPRKRHLHATGRRIHGACALLMLLAVAWILVNFATKRFAHASVEDFLLYGEWGAIWGFAISFVAQGVIHTKTAPAVRD